MGGARADNSEFVGVKEAKIDNTGGMPRLIINGKPVLPIVFFFNTDIWKPQTIPLLTSQAKMAANAGVHIYSLTFRYNRPNGIDPDFTGLDSFLDAFIKNDPQALFIVRLFVGPNQSWKEWKAIPDEDRQLYADGTRGPVSFASDWAWKPSDDDLTRMIRRYEASPYGKRILVYQVGDSGHSELFLDRYREAGADYCGANQKRFRQWLTNHYKTDEALQKAWADPKVTFATAQIPRAAQGRFPMHSVLKSEKIPFFYDQPGEQSWIDFSIYSNNLVGDRVIAWAKLVKKETNGKKLNAFFYGYTYELPGSISGHLSFQRVLECPQVDILVSPVAYSGRGVGEGGLWMTSIDSVSRHGKLWLQEDDTQTYLIDKNVYLSIFKTPFANPETKDLNETTQILDRNIGALLAHRAGMWWMDLNSCGAFNEQSLWTMLQNRMALYEKVYQKPSPYRGEVGLIADEISKFYVKSDWDANFLGLANLRNAVAKTGATIGYYTLGDFIAGNTPRCKAYIFPNTFYLTDKQISAVQSRLDREQATAIWFYAPGLLGPKGSDIKRASKLTGMQLAVKEGGMGTQGVGSFKSETWGPTGGDGSMLVCSPRLTVTDPKAEALGQYKTDQSVSAAQTQQGNHRSIFLGDLSATPMVLMRLFEQAGAHIWTRDGSVVITDGKFLVVHTVQEGLKPISLPTGLKAEAITGKIEKTEKSPTGGDIIYMNFQKGDTRWIKLTK